ncbi:MAG: UvrB/UvrC motif-containing protein [Pirellulales bacterium]
MSSEKNFDALLREWNFDPHSLSVRLVKGEDGRDVIQVRVDLGILQLETTGRPDGQQPNNAPTYLDALLEIEKQDPDFVMDEDQCMEADREFVQYYHRRVAWLRLLHFRRAVQDADHTLGLMDVCRDHSPDEDWTMSHEQYRPFVLFHRTRAAALAELDDHGPEKAIAAINEGLDRIKEVFQEHDAEEAFDEDEMVLQLIEFRESLRNDYSVGKTLSEQLADAVASEQYELAAQLRDQLAKQQGS